MEVEVAMLIKVIEYDDGDGQYCTISKPKLVYISMFIVFKITDCLLLGLVL